MLAVSVLTLASCGKSKVSYDDFHSAATSVEASDYNYVAFSGKYTAKLLGVTSTVDLSKVTATKTSSGWGTADGTETAQTTVALALIIDTAATVGKSDDYKYYSGDGFKVEYDADGKKYDEWNKYGLLTKTTDGTNTITLSWSKK